MHATRLAVFHRACLEGQSSTPQEHQCLEHLSSPQSMLQGLVWCISRRGAAAPPEAPPRAAPTISTSVYLAATSATSVDVSTRRWKVPLSTSLTEQARVMGQTFEGSASPECR